MHKEIKKIMGKLGIKNNSTKEITDRDNTSSLIEQALYKHFGRDNIEDKTSEKNIQNRIFAEIISTPRTKHSIVTRISNYFLSDFKYNYPRFFINIMMLSIIFLLSLVSLLSIKKLDYAQTSRSLDNAVIEVSNSVSGDQDDFNYLSDIDKQLQELEQI